MCSVLLNVEILLKCEENLVNILCNGVLINIKVIVRYLLRMVFIGDFIYLI